MEPAFKEHFVVSSGFTSSGLTIGLLDTITVLSGGTMSSTVVSGGGLATISAGGLAQFDVISSGGVETLLVGGLADGEQVQAGGTIEGAGELLEANVFGVVSGVSLLDFNDVQSGGLITGVTIAPSGANTTSVLSGGSASNVLVSGAATELRVFGGGEADGVSLSAGGEMTLLANAAAKSPVVRSGGDLLVVGGLASSVVVSSGGTLELFGPVLSDDFATVFTGGTIRDAGGISDGDVLSGGAEIVQGASEAENFDVKKGGLLTVESLGVAETGNVQSGGELVASSGGAVANMFVGLFGVLIVQSGAVVGSENEIGSGGLVEFLDPAVSGQTVVLPSSASLPGTVLGVTIDSGGGYQLVDPTVGNSGVLSFGGALSGATVSFGGRLLGPGSIVGDGFVNSDQGLVSGVGLGAGVAFVVESAGVASGVTASGTAVQITIQSGGLGVGFRELAALDRITVAGGGVASATTLRAGADEVVFGTTYSTHVSNGTEYVESGGKTHAAVIFAGGQEMVQSGGSAAGATLSGGALTIFAGGSLMSGLTIEAGQATVVGAAISGQTVRFAGSAGVLELANVGGFHAKIAGLKSAGQAIDLRGFSFSSGETATWAQTGTSGTLTVHDAAKATSLTLVGTYVTSDFHLARDSQGGTLVTDPRGEPATAPPEVVTFVAAAATLAPAPGCHHPATSQPSATERLPLVAMASSGR